MESLVISIPVAAEFTAGDYADVYLNDVRINSSPIDFFPRTSPAPGHLAGGHLVGPHIEPVQPGGHLQGAHLLDTHLEPARVISVGTPPLYYGLQVVRVETLDYLGNESPDTPAEEAVFLDTGPTAPKSLQFGSQVGAGPVTFSFTESVELST